jgi:2-isopropylmalate synthase
MLEVASRSGASAAATVTLRHADGRSVSRKSEGDGPVDAAYKAIEQATGVTVKVRKFEVHAVTIGEDAQGETVVYVDYNDRSYRGSSVSTDIIEASCKALLEVVNRIEQSSQSGARATARTAAGRTAASA